MIGKKFERLTVVSQISAKKWHCVCDCGNTKDVYESSLFTGHRRSCGCLVRDVLMARNVKHGMVNHPAYENWCGMIKRCFNPNDDRYESYMGRGISVHPDFRESFVAFLNEIGEKPEGKGWSVGRIDNNGWYTYGNIRWETKEQQARNHTRQKNNTSGTTGVKLSKAVNRNNYESWMASWNDETGRKTKAFGCNKYGFEQAKQMAIDYRKKMIEELNERGFEYAISHGSDKEELNEPETEER